ncbi:MAG: hypothetical protein OXN27_15860 [Candidatus Poribacteria bacterium]|nr:hypothetical protein [Candidatus Poribacteria bacterium]
MNVKSEVISEIDGLLSEYIEKKDNNYVAPNDEAGYYALLGAIEALKFLKSMVENIDDTQYKTLRIVEESSEDFQWLRPASSFLSDVLLKIEITLNDKRVYGHPGSGANPNAMPGREEVCMRIKRFVYDLHDELADEK